jgi:GTP pyrophosphokinase
MGKMRSELEDLAFQNLYPEEYKPVGERCRLLRRPELEGILENKKGTIEETRLEENDVPFVEVQGRVKRLYSLWKKLKKQKLMIEQVYDLIAARVITTNDKKELLPRALVLFTISRTPVP